ncbi:MAG: excinuclease ABC subunit UvrA [Candidatus Omnitrophica bacterium]|nr:excinuclease ABC subunit UvrA [Candidatus Omnitrophota bacterium]
MNDAILLKGVNTHNLKHIDVAIPHGTLTVITGVSGSGKSSLAFDTLYAEGRRRYVESLSAYSRQFLERLEKPDLEFASGILPAIAIEVKNVVTNARSTVGTQTELNDYLRLLFARVGVTYCSSCGQPVSSDSAGNIWEKIVREFDGHFVTVAFPLKIGKKERSFAREIFDEMERQGFLNFIVSGVEMNLEQMRKRVDGTGSVAGQVLSQTGKKNLSRPEPVPLSVLVIVDQLELNPANRSRILDSLESALKYGKGSVSILAEKNGKKQERKFSNRFHCADCDIEYLAPNPNQFSFNSPLGACPECQGFGRVITIDQNLVVPNPRLTLAEGAIEPWTKPSAAWEFKELKAFAKRRKIPMDRPFAELSAQERRWILEGSDDRNFSSVRDFFKYLEKKTYRMHVRIFLSKYRGFLICPKCKGTRLKPEALNVKINQKNIADLSTLTIESLKEFFDRLVLSEHDEAVAEAVLLEIKNRLLFLIEVGLGYLTLERLSRTLSGGEAQRIHLASSLGSALVDTLYVLDEPSVGLHERDNALLIRLLEKLKNLGNTVVIVEHDRTMIEAADQIIDLGPLGGEGGGEIVFSGPFRELTSVKDSYTARYFRGEFKIERRRIGTGSVAGQVSKPNGSRNLSRPEPVPLPRSIKIQTASEHNLKNISLEIPLGQFVVITGVSGSGKSTLMYDILYANYQRWRGRSVQDVGRVGRIDGWNEIGDLLLIDQSPIGRTSRSNPVTYVKAFDQIRKVFASTRDAKAHRLSAGHFSFNVPGGRCEKCEGAGVTKIEMHFLADIYITCEACGGSRYQSRILEMKYRGKNIRGVLDMTIDQALEFFSAKGGSAADGKEEPKICNSLAILSRVGLGYLALGQSATTLSGGEAQRLKLAAELSAAKRDHLLYLFDEPTTGLHYYDITYLLAAFETLLNAGHSICVIEHNMEVIKCADYVIDLGPEGGEGGGEVVYAGPLEGLFKAPRSHTGNALQKYTSRAKIRLF